MIDTLYLPLSSMKIMYLKKKKKQTESKWNIPYKMLGQPVSKDHFV